MKYFCAFKVDQQTVDADTADDDDDVFGKRGGRNTSSKATAETRRRWQVQWQEQQWQQTSVWPLILDGVRRTISAVDLNLRQ